MTEQQTTELEALAHARKTLEPKELLKIGLQIPPGPKEALSMAADTSVFSRTTMNHNGDVLPGMRSLSPKMKQLKVNIMERIHAELGDKVAKDCSYLLSTTGFVNNPIGTIERSERVSKHCPKFNFVLRVIRRFAERLARDAKITGSLAVPRKSTTGFPQMATGDLALALRMAYVHSWQSNLPAIAEHLANGDWDWLTRYDARTGRLGIYPVSHQSKREQPQKAKNLLFGLDGALKDIEKPVRDVVDATGRNRKTDASIPNSWQKEEDYRLLMTQRGRQIRAVSASGNLPKQMNDHAIRCGAHENLAAWYLSDPSADIPRAMAQIRLRSPNFTKGYRIVTLDFHNMDHSEGIEQETAWVDGLCDGGYSDAYRELSLALHLGPMITPEDDQFRRPRTPTKVDGSMVEPIRFGKDRGRGSGESHTDIGNKTIGSCIYGSNLYYAGAFPSLQAECDREGVAHFSDKAATKLADYLYDEALRQNTRLTDKAAFLGEYGDDCAVAICDDRLPAFEKELAACEPDWHISVEDDQQLIGWSIDRLASRVTPYHGRHISAVLSPERFYDDPMRANGWMIGVPVNYQHYNRDPLNQALSRILDEECIKLYGVDPRTIAKRYAPNVPNVVAHSIADLQVIMDPSTITWKWAREDISPNVLEWVDQFYYTIEPETLEKCQLKGVA